MITRTAFERAAQLAPTYTPRPLVEALAAAAAAPAPAASDPAAGTLHVLISEEPQR